MDWTEYPPYFVVMTKAERVSGMMENIQCMYRFKKSGVRCEILAANHRRVVAIHWPILSFLFSWEYTERNSTCLSSMPILGLTLRNIMLRHKCVWRFMYSSVQVNAQLVAVKKLKWRGTSGCVNISDRSRRTLQQLNSPLLHHFAHFTLTEFATWSVYP